VILYIETSTQVCSAGLSHDGKWLALREDRSRDYSHSALLTVFMEEVLKEAGIEAGDVDAVAVSRGPGSYTGLRIGVSAAKGFCFGLDIPLIAVDTLKALTASLIGPDPGTTPSGSGATAQDPGTTTSGSGATAPDPGATPSGSVASSESPKKPALTGGPDVLYCPMIDARRMEVYYALFTPGLKEVRPTAAEVITADTFGELLEKQRIVFFGDGAEKCRQLIDSPNALFFPDILPSVRGMLQLAEEQYRRKDFVDVAYFEPYYLKDFVAGKPKVKGLYS